MSAERRGLAALLAAERAALLSGRFEELGPIRDTKETLWQQLSAQPDMTALTTLAADLARNARLLEAALSGLREGHARAGALRAAQGGFATYGRDGRPRAPAATPALRHKA
ncbi:hypothetical protein [Limimaricola hongkongensis]|uniref:Flagellar protein FlgN n=1 Tax=Limimaricola hongkongensis DSM 17492 TaxID=1122180 RepID=A0A017HFL0_9RHOB|nr:hypothetical protein [Limimaricola hongkongensis]EYD73146.1 hypothetical protein Lokhon_00672 [Limimaricola hongkongensis DSM 17492]